MIQIEMKMPEGCDECRFETDCGFCKAMPANFCGNTTDGKRPEWCPLKEQEPVKPTTSGGTTWFYKCGICGIPIDPRDVYCRECGRAIDWS